MVASSCWCSNFGDGSSREVHEYGECFSCGDTLESMFWTLTKKATFVPEMLDGFCSFPHSERLMEHQAAAVAAAMDAVEIDKKLKYSLLSLLKQMQVFFRRQREKNRLLQFLIWTTTKSRLEEFAQELVELTRRLVGHSDGSPQPLKAAPFAAGNLKDALEKDGSALMQAVIDDLTGATIDTIKDTVENTFKVSLDECVDTMEAIRVFGHRKGLESELVEKLVLIRAHLESVSHIYLFDRPNLASICEQELRFLNTRPMGR
ncbi:hypothetical protein HDU91_002061, partial [Kappamyces sp. JEL0680]